MENLIKNRKVFKNSQFRVKISESHVFKYIKKKKFNRLHNGEELKCYRLLVSEFLFSNSIALKYIYNVENYDVFSWNLKF